VSERTRLLAGLHAQCGFASRKDLIDALVALGGPSRGTAAKANGSTTGTGSAKKRKRARITTELRNDVVKALQAAQAAGDIAKRYSISSQTVQNIKKAAGLVKSRKKRSN
jgi:transposase